MIGMTGFGEAAAESGGLQLSVKVHGVNHRYLEVFVRSPDELRFAEARVRERVAAVARRGRCEVAISVRRPRAPTARAEIDAEAVQALHRAAQPLIAAGLLRSEMSLGDLLRQPALVRIEASQTVWTEEDEALLEKVVDAAVGAFAASRALDGEKSRRALEAIVKELEAVAASLRDFAPAAAARLAQQLRGRFSELARETSWSEERWLHEAALLAEKADVREELARFEGHLRELADLIRSGTGGGRRIDFLAQELLRELNTLAAKCRDLELVQAALTGRLLCEQIREQAQNVE